MPAETAKLSAGRDQSSMRNRVVAALVPVGTKYAVLSLPVSTLSVRQKGAAGNPAFKSKLLLRQLMSRKVDEILLLQDDGVC